jgi:hypothetical protein
MQMHVNYSDRHLRMRIATLGPAAFAATIIGSESRAR